MQGQRLTVDILRAKWKELAQPQLLVVLPEDAVKLSEWMNSVLDLLTEALDWEHAAGCSGGIKVLQSDGSYAQPYSCRCGYHEWERRVMEIIGEEASNNADKAELQAALDDSLICDDRIEQTVMAMYDALEATGFWASLTNPQPQPTPAAALSLILKLAKSNTTWDGSWAEFAEAERVLRRALGLEAGQG